MPMHNIAINKIVFTSDLILYRFHINEWIIKKTKNEINPNLMISIMLQEIVMKWLRINSFFNE